MVRVVRAGTAVTRQTACGFDIAHGRWATGDLKIAEVVVLPLAQVACAGRSVCVTEAGGCEAGLLVGDVCGRV
jgi:hypothetical protein